MSGFEVGEKSEGIFPLGEDEVKGPRSMLSIAPLRVARPLARGLEPRASTAAEGPRASPRPQPTVERTRPGAREGIGRRHRLLLKR